MKQIPNVRDTDLDAVNAIATALKTIRASLPDGASAALLVTDASGRVFHFTSAGQYLDWIEAELAVEDEAAPVAQASTAQWGMPRTLLDGADITDISSFLSVDFSEGVTTYTIDLLSTPHLLQELHVSQHSATIHSLQFNTGDDMERPNLRVSVESISMINEGGTPITRVVFRKVKTRDSES